MTLTDGKTSLGAIFRSGCNSGSTYADTTWLHTCNV